MESKYLNEATFQSNAPIDDGPAHYYKGFRDYKKGWVLGYISKDDFKKKSTFHKKGERDGGFIFRHSC